MAMTLLPMFTGWRVDRSRMQREFYWNGELVVTESLLKWAVVRAIA